MIDDRRLLRGYPVQWRERYGSELLALVEDVSGGRSPSRRVRTSLLVAGLKERLREQALIGLDRPPVDRVRAGARVILVAWALVVVAGCGFAKFSEHWQASVPAQDRFLPGFMYETVLVLGAVGALALLGVVAAAIPCLRRAISAGQWRPTRRQVLGVVALSLLVCASTVALALSARHLTAVHRNGASAIAVVAFACWVLLIVAAIAAWTTAALAAERRMIVTPSLTRAMGIGAGVVALCTVVIAGSILTWWIALARTAPWALAGRPVGAAASPWVWPLPAVAAAAVVAAAVAVLGATRLSSSRSDSRRTLPRA